MLPRINRLTKKEDFENVRQNGKFLSTPLFTVSWVKRPDFAEASSRQARFGFIVSKKISTKANVRNKIKRHLREIVRKNLPKSKNGYDFVILAKSGILHTDTGTIETELTKILNA